MERQVFFDQFILLVDFILVDRSDAKRLGCMLELGVLYTLLILDSILRRHWPRGLTRGCQTDCQGETGTERSASNIWHRNCPSRLNDETARLS